MRICYLLKETCLEKLLSGYKYLWMQNRAIMLLKYYLQVTVRLSKKPAFLMQAFTKGYIVLSEIIYFPVLSNL